MMKITLRFSCCALALAAFIQQAQAADVPPGTQLAKQQN